MNEILSIVNPDMLPGKSMLEMVCRLEVELLKMPQSNIKTEHKFSPGTYERTIIIPPWTVLTGAEHKTPYSVRLEKGTIAVNTDDGVKVLTAPCEFLAPAGVKRVGRVFQDEVVWTDIYENKDDCKDLSIIEGRLYVVPDCGLGENRVALMIEKDRKDFRLFLDQMGMTQDQMDAVVQMDHDLIPMPESFNVELRDSALHGKGLFAIKEFSAGELICPGRINGKRTPAGRFINHSSNPNATTSKVGDDIEAVAIRKIQENEEIVIDYRTSMKVNFGIAFQEEPSCQGG